MIILFLIQTLVQAIPNCCHVGISNAVMFHQSYKCMSKQKVNTLTLFMDIFVTMETRTRFIIRNWVWSAKIITTIHKQKTMPCWTNNLITIDLQDRSIYRKKYLALRSSNNTNGPTPVWKGVSYVLKLELEYCIWYAEVISGELTLIINGICVERQFISKWCRRRSATWPP